MRGQKATHSSRVGLRLTASAFAGPGSPPDSLTSVLPGTIKSSSSPGEEKQPLITVYVYTVQPVYSLLERQGPP